MNKSNFIIAFIFSTYFIYYCFTYTDWHFIDNINLIIHEAGHFIFLPFGQFMHILGGSLVQIVFPAMFVFYFYKKEDYFSASLLLFWVGQNIINVSVYASDAILMQLPLLGGDSVMHDWNNILSNLGMLNYAKSIGFTIFILGIFIIILAIFLSISSSFSKKLKIQF